MNGAAGKVLAAERTGTGLVVGINTISGRLGWYGDHLAWDGS